MPKSTAHRSRHWKSTIPLLTAAALLAGTWTACLPRDERPGLWLRGEPAVTPDDWRFARDVDEIFIETKHWYGLRQSNTIWCAEIDGALYVGSYGDHKKAWEENIAHSPEARLAIEGKLYEVRLAPVTDPGLIDAIDSTYTEKYDMAEVFGDELPQWWYYRVTRRGKEVSNRTSSTRSH